ncbi:MAG: flagellar basal body rod protein FlgC [Planctomycetota bacterium]
MKGMQGVFTGFDIAASGMRTEMQRAEVVAANVANMHVTKGPDGLPYRRRTVVVEETAPSGFAAVLGSVGAAPGGTRVVRVATDTSTPFVPRFDPGHPHADANGFVLMSNVDIFKEMVDMAVIQRSFEANIASMQAYRGMLQTALQNIRV